MQPKDIFYKESGIINPLGFSLGSLILLVSALLLGYVYNVVIVVIPLVYLNVLITAGLGLVSGFILRFCIRISSNRNRKSQIIQAVVFGVFILYFQWLAYVLYAFEAAIPSPGFYLLNLGLIFSPEGFFGTIAEINRQGLWSMFGVDIKGFAATAIWIAEALIIIAGPTIAVLTNKIYPFSELQNKWYPKFTLIADFESFAGSQTMIDDLQNNPTETLQKLGKGNGYRFTKAHLFYSKEELNQYLSLEKVLIDSKGKKKGDILINNLRISKAQAEEILENFEAKRERLDIF